MPKKSHLFFNDVFTNYARTRCGRIVHIKMTKTKIEEVDCEQCKLLANSFLAKKKE